MFYSFLKEHLNCVAPYSVLFLNQVQRAPHLSHQNLKIVINLFVHRFRGILVTSRLKMGAIWSKTDKIRGFTVPSRWKYLHCEVGFKLLYKCRTCPRWLKVMNRINISNDLHSYKSYFSFITLSNSQMKWNMTELFKDRLSKLQVYESVFFLAKHPAYAYNSKSVWACSPRGQGW